MTAHKAYIPTLLTLALLAVAFAVTLPALAHGTESHTQKNTTASSTIKMKKNKSATTTVNLTCMQTAVDTREDALGTAFSTFHDDVEEALTARKTALHDAWGLTNKTERLSAVKSARETFKKSHGVALKDLKKARMTAWATFKTTAKTSCKETLPKGEDAVEKETAGSIAI